MAELKILAVCSRNLWRSPTAAHVINQFPDCTGRSAGTAASARIRVTESLVEWADIILAMERKHVVQLRERFPTQMGDKEVHCLDIPDDYPFMDPDLVEMIGETLNGLVGNRCT